MRKVANRTQAGSKTLERLNCVSLELQKASGAILTPSPVVGNECSNAGRTVEVRGGEEAEYSVQYLQRYYKDRHYVGCDERSRPARRSKLKEGESI